MPFNPAGVGFGTVRGDAALRGASSDALCKQGYLGSTPGASRPIPAYVNISAAARRDPSWARLPPGPRWSPFFHILGDMWAPYELIEADRRRYGNRANAGASAPSASDGRLFRP